MAQEKPRRCPVCRARFRQQPLCSRCGADLYPLMSLALKAFLLRQSSRAALRSGDFYRAHKLAQQAQKLCGTPIGHSLGILTSWLLFTEESDLTLPEQPSPPPQISEPEFESKLELEPEPPPPMDTPSLASIPDKKTTESVPATEKQNLIAKGLRFIKQFINR